MQRDLAFGSVQYGMAFLGVHACREGSIEQPRRKSVDPHGRERERQAATEGFNRRIGPPLAHGQWIWPLTQDAGDEDQRPCGFNLCGSGDPDSHPRTSRPETCRRLRD